MGQSVTLVPFSTFNLFCSFFLLGLKKMLKCINLIYFMLMKMLTIKDSLYNEWICVCYPKVHCFNMAGFTRSPFTPDKWCYLPGQIMPFQMCMQVPSYINCLLAINTIQVLCVKRGPTIQALCVKRGPNHPGTLC